MARSPRALALVGVAPGAASGPVASATAALAAFSGLVAGLVALEALSGSDTETVTIGAILRPEMSYKPTSGRSFCIRSICRWCWACEACALWSRGRSLRVLCLYLGPYRRLRVLLFGRRSRFWSGCTRVRTRCTWFGPRTWSRRTSRVPCVLSVSFRIPKDEISPRAKRGRPVLTGGSISFRVSSKSPSSPISENPSLSQKWLDTYNFGLSSLLLDVVDVAELAEVILEVAAVAVPAKVCDDNRLSSHSVLLVYN